MSDIPQDSVEALLPQRLVLITTRSGRQFRFDITEYAVFSCTTRADVSLLAERIVSEKYRYCQWDREHPSVNAEAEILEALTERLWLIVQSKASPVPALFAKLFDSVTYKGKRRP